MEAVARFRNVPTSPRKMRLVANLIRGREVGHALSLLKYQPNHAAKDMFATLRSAVANWEQKNPDSSLENTVLYVKTVFVDGGRVLKRLRPAPQGRAFRVRKRSNHITIIVDALEEAGASLDQAQNQTINTEE